MNVIDAFQAAHPNIYGMLFCMIPLAIIILPAFLIFNRNPNRIARGPGWMKSALGFMGTTFFGFLTYTTIVDNGYPSPVTSILTLGSLFIMFDGVSMFFIKPHGVSHRPAQMPDHEVDQFGGPLAKRSRDFNRTMVQNGITMNDFESVRLNHKGKPYTDASSRAILKELQEGRPNVSTRELNGGPRRPALKPGSNGMINYEED